MPVERGGHLVEDRAYRQVGEVGGKHVPECAGMS
jgi:hypothetical protein